MCKTSDEIDNNNTIIRHLDHIRDMCLYHSHNSWHGVQLAGQLRDLAEILTEKPPEKAEHYAYIGIQDDNGHASTLAIYDDTPDYLTVLGVIPHTAQIQPRSIDAASRLINFLHCYILRELQDGET